MSACAKCGGAMTAGYILDDAYHGKKVANWVEGEPERSMWTGLKTGDRMVIPVTTWRCDRCGYLESYAT